MFGRRKATGEILPEGYFDSVSFKDKDVRRIIHDDEFYFSLVDAIEVLTESNNPRRYWSDLKAKLVQEEGFEELYDNIVQLKMVAEDGKERLTDTANVETLFRIIQSIPSKKAEPFKRWLAKTGYERILEYQNPDIAIKRAILGYKDKGRTDEWIDNRIKCLLSRDALTREWGSRGIVDRQYGILTNLVHEGTFAISVKRHESIKGLKKSHNLRDHMTSTELALTSLGETATREIAVSRDAQGFYENQKAAQEGGRIAGNARKEIEKATGASVVSRHNFLPGKNTPKELSNGS